MQLTWRGLALLVLAAAFAATMADTLLAADSHAGPINISVDPKEAYIETRGAEQRLNFDLLIHNDDTQPLRINKIEISVYDSSGVLVLRRFLDENGVPCGVCTLPDRIVPAHGWLDVFNPFHAFSAEIPLGRLHYELLFEDPAQQQPNLLTFATRADVDIHPTAYPGKTYLALPLHGRIYVFDGHDFYSHHRRQNVFRSGHFRPNSVRYAYDLMIMDPAGGLYHGDRFKKEDWLSYGVPVFAPAAGTVVDAANDIPENSYDEGHVVYPQLPDSADPVGLGNHVTLSHGNGEFSILVHMKPGSVTVKKGDSVRLGQQIGAVGFSGDTFLPHLHYMIMSGEDERTSQGLPSYFSGFKRVLGAHAQEVSHGQIDSGDILEFSPGEVSAP